MAYCCATQFKLSMLELDLDPTNYYPVMVYDVRRGSLSIANNVDEYVNIWNASPINQSYGLFEKITGEDFLFALTPANFTENVSRSIRIYGEFQENVLPQLEAPTELTFSDITTNSAKANWINTPAVNPPIGFQYQNTTVPNFSNITNGSGSGSGYPNPPVQALTGLDPATTYYYRVRTIDTANPATNAPSVWVDGSYTTSPTSGGGGGTHTALVKSFDNDPFVDNSTAIDMTGATVLIIADGANISSNLPIGWNGKFVVWMEPTSEPIKNFWDNGNTNSGNLTPSGDATMRQPFPVASNRYYASRDAAGLVFDNTIPFSLTV